jgi:peptidoglycan/xylan/chitin deacetylase (PgdA/CDA1 family)
MIYDSKIHTVPMLVKSVLGRIVKNLNGLNYDDNELIVVNYHSTPKKFIHNFESQIIALKKMFHILKSDELDDYYAGKKPKQKKNYLLITFDDGLKNNLFAAEVMEKHDITAFFFIIPKFADTAPDEQKNYYIKCIRPIINRNIDNEEEDFTALSWSEIATLAGKGHAIGSHTYTHTLIAQQSDMSNSEFEIVNSKHYLMNKLGISIQSFCSINNSLLSVHAKEKKLISENYRYHFTTLPGLNVEGKNPLFIKRRNIESHWLKGAVYYALGKSDLPRWKNRIMQYENI